MTLFNIFTGFLLFSSAINPIALYSKPGETILSSHSISLEKRYSVKSVNEVFKDNILLNIAYLKGDVKRTADIDWDKIKKPFLYELVINPGETFAYSDDTLPEYKGKVARTTNAHFNLAEGFKSDGYLAGDGVCHLASIIYWAAKDAGLDAVAPTNHDFAAIPEIPKEYGVSIYYNPGQSSSNARQNLYITNNSLNSIIMKFVYDGENLEVSVVSTKLITQFQV